MGRLAPINFGRIANTLSKIRIALGATFALVAIGWFLFDYLTKPNLGVGMGIILGVMIGAFAFLCGWGQGLALTWILKWLDWLLSP